MQRVPDYSEEYDIEPPNSISRIFSEESQLPFALEAESSNHVQVTQDFRGFWGVLRDFGGF